MQKPNLLPALAIAAIGTATLSLPATATAAPFRHEEAPVMVRVDPMRNIDIRPVHDVVRYSDSYGPARWAPPYYPRGPHYGYPHERRYRHTYGPVVRYEPRRDYRPVVRYEQRSDYRPIERYEPPRDNDIRVRISYDVHM